MSKVIRLYSTSTQVPESFTWILKIKKRFLHSSFVAGI